MRRSFLIGDKKKIVKEARKISARAAAKKFKVDRKCIRLWLAQDAQGLLDEHDPDRRRIDGGGRPIISEALEGLLMEAIKSERQMHHRVTRNKVVQMAARIIDGMEEKPALKLSDGWLDCFLHRHRLVQRKVTNKPKHSVEVIATRGANFVRHVREIMSTYNIQPQNIVNFDETAVFAEHNKDSTLEERGATDVPVQSFGLEKVRVTAVFGARADGSKLKPCLMVSGKVPSVCVENGVPVLTNKNSWMETDSFIRYIDYMFPFVAPNTLLLVFDSARSHISKRAKAHLHKRQILFAVIPGGLTPYLQPCDYGLFKPLKDRITNCIDQWKEHGPHEFTAGGNVRPPPRAMMIGWLKEAWNEVVEPMVRRSFRSCFMGDDEELVLWRHEVYGTEFQRLLRGGGEPSLATATIIDGESDMELEDEFEIDFAALGL